MKWPDRRILDLFGIDLPIIQAPMAGASTPQLAIAVSAAGGLGSLPCAFLDDDAIRTAVELIRSRTTRPLNLNFFCHQPPAFDAERDRAWRQRLAPYYAELGLELGPPTAPSLPPPFDDARCALAIELEPAVVSFHFGLPETKLVDRLRAAGLPIISSATTVREARWLTDHGCSAVIAQGAEAGGHRGLFLSEDVAGQVGTIALVPQVVDAVDVPVIAAGGIADARGIVAALALGASAVQIGTGYLRCPEASISPLHRAALSRVEADKTAITNVFSGRPARAIVNRFLLEVGPISDLAPDFPLARSAIAPLQATAEARAADDFSFMLTGQAAPLGRDRPAGELTRALAAETLARLS